MVSFTFEKTGWLNRYLLYRASTPFEPTEPYRKLAAGKIGEKSFDDCLYAEVKENGMLLGCPVITMSVKDLSLIHI